ncbi:MAG: hypothetical protein A2Y33_16130 [Spirochaetes bacterium GWF1_51_8]|nr:MAG: hypothetical protein A2Y33_16130 [Spirochaetes bacterium GWF1_51_8]
MKPNDIPKVSVVTPVYNRAFMLDMVLDSLVKQAYPNIELICVDDGSTDNSAEIIKRYPQVKYIYQKNAGPAAARNTGIDAATGEIVHFIDSDVIAPPELIGLHAAEHLKRDRLIVQGQLVRILDLEDAYKMPYSTWHYSRAFFDTANVSIRKEYLLEQGCFDAVNFRKGWEDLDLGLRLMKSGIHVKRLTKTGYIWHYEGRIRIDHIQDFFADRFVEGKAAVNFYRKHPTFEVKMMTMIGGFFYWLDRVLFKEEYLTSQKFIDDVKKLWDKNEKNKCIAKIRLNGYHFYFNGIKAKIKEEGYLLKK